MPFFLYDCLANNFLINYITKLLIRKSAFSILLKLFHKIFELNISSYKLIANRSIRL